MKKYGVIMAGGGGSRFWPLSRQKTPKQLLNLSGKELMVNEAIDRLSYTADNKDIFIVTNCTQAQSMRQATDGRILPDHILAEPSARNTSACIGYAAMEILRKYGDDEDADVLTAMKQPLYSSDISKIQNHDI